jgi:plastocyanin
VITLALDDGATETTVSHPAHIHENSASETGPIAIYLSPLDGTANPANNGTSARLVDRPFDELAAFDGYVNIHESVANISNVVSQGNIGSNATGTLGAGLNLVDGQESITYPLDAIPNGGTAAPNGIPGEVQLLELTDELTLATIRLDVDGDGTYEDDATGANVSHPAHIHQNSASETGPIEFFLSPVDGTDPAAKSSQILEATFDELTGFDGYVNVHESAANLADVVSQGNIGSNAGTGSTAADVTITINNIGASAWEVTGVDGANLSEISDGASENPALTLTVGTRYRFNNNGGSGAHPLGFQNASSDYLLRQDGTGSLEGNADINYAEDDNGVTFTYTQTLADQVATYICTFHSSMEGDIQTN